ncbi:MAG: hypothetical protein IJZ12_03480 [Clostridia bacterium]|nr:hypothetical protein [Clostridia bacterium]
MAKLLIANYIEHIDVLTKIMAVRIGKDSTIYIQKDVLDKIFLSIKIYNYETGGIMGVDKNGVISAFQYDETQSLNPFEYCPNVKFLNQVISEKWANQNIEFVGFMHSHLNNTVLSLQDVIYARDILKQNRCLKNIVIGVINLGENKNHMKLYLIGMKEKLKISYIVV